MDRVQVNWESAGVVHPCDSSVSGGLHSEHPSVLASSLGFDSVLQQCLSFSSTLKGALSFECIQKVSTLYDLDAFEE